MTAVGVRFFIAWWCCGGLASLFNSVAIASDSVQPVAPNRMWERLLTEAEQLHLPTAFLKAMAPNFIHFEFDDLRTYAAEYHPGEHRMVLNRSLSFNAAGGTLKPLPKMTHKELDVLYHELFHAYMDFSAGPGQPPVEANRTSNELVDFARAQQVCRYGKVEITPIVQRNDETESRYLTESESWEALNETWAVFIGWAVWNQLEVQRKGKASMLRHQREVEDWLRRFELAFHRGEFRGYYVPEDPDERRVTQKRFLAKPSQLTWKESAVLMKQVLGFSEKFVDEIEKRPGLSQHVGQASNCEAYRER